MGFTITHSKVTGGAADSRYSVDLADWDATHTISGSVTASEVTSGAALTKTDDTNVTLTLGGTPTAALLQATSITVGWTGTLAASRGGTGISSLGTGVATALGVNVGTAGSFVVNGGALGTPSSGTLTNATGLPLSTGITGAGTGVLTALAVNVGSAGAFVTFNGALGTPSSGTLTNATGLPVSTGISGLGSGVATFLAAPSSANLASAVTGETGSGALVFGTSPTLTTPNIVGTSTNDSAAAGSVGEYVSSTIASGSAISLSTGTAANLTSISLTAGDWDVWVNSLFIPAGTTNVTILANSVSTTSATHNITGTTYAQLVYPGSVLGANSSSTVGVTTRLSLSATTTVYAVVSATFTVSTMTSWGSIQARRVR
jgi:hypothetical protein